MLREQADPSDAGTQMYWLERVDAAFEAHRTTNAEQLQECIRGQSSSSQRVSCPPWGDVVLHATRLYLHMCMHMVFDVVAMYVDYLITTT